MRLIAAVAAGKAAGAATRLAARGGGTALPGLIAERIEPRLVERLAAQLGRGSVAITGTNGKTTAARIFASICAAGGVPTVHNREGSNLMRGIASRLLAAADLRGRIPKGSRTLGLFETDEATFPAAVRALQPRAMAFTNLFRDQLDRYGEVDTVAALWREGLAVARRDATLVLNADDPSVAELAEAWPGPVHWFGIDDPAFATAMPGATDARWCGCGGSFAYERRYFAHIGWWRCERCGRARPRTQTTASNLRLTLDHATFAVDGLGEVEMALTGLYNVANALAAIGLARSLGLEGEAIRRGLAEARAAFGRQEVIALEGRRLRLFLAKNPAGANQVLRLLAAIEGPPAKVALLLNDRFADGQDVSWIWDVDHELLAGRVERCWVGGDRAEDLALRLKYAGWPAPAVITHDAARLIDAILAGTAPGDEVHVIPTYTALLDFRAAAARRTPVGRF